MGFWLNFARSKKMLYELISFYPASGNFNELLIDFGKPRLLASSLRNEVMNNWE